MEKSMSRIAECDVTDCAYNKHNSCHTLAITVGGRKSVRSATPMSSARTAAVFRICMGVGACKVASCKHNELLECNAFTVKIGWHQNHPDCRTFEHK